MIDYSAISCVVLVGILAAQVISMTRRPRESASVDRLTAALVRAYNEGFRKMSAQLDALTAALVANTTATNNAIAAGIGSGSGTGSPPAEDLSAAIAQVEANTAALVAHTPNGVGSVGEVITVSPASISGSVGTPFTTQLAASGGVAPYTLATSDSFVNTGASLNSDGTVNAATVAGTDTVNVTATDSTGATGTTAVTVTAA